MLARSPERILLLISPQALPSKGKEAEAAIRKGSEDRMAFEVDDEASFATKQDEMVSYSKGRYRRSQLASKRWQLLPRRQSRGEHVGYQ